MLRATARVHLDCDGRSLAAPDPGRRAPQEEHEQLAPAPRADPQLGRGRAEHPDPDPGAGGAKREEPAGDRRLGGLGEDAQGAGGARAGLRARRSTLPCATAPRRRRLRQRLRRPRHADGDYEICDRRRPSASGPLGQRDRQSAGRVPGDRAGRRVYLGRAAATSTGSRRGTTTRSATRPARRSTCATRRAGRRGARPPRRCRPGALHRAARLRAPPPSSTSARDRHRRWCSDCTRTPR